MPLMDPNNQIDEQEYQKQLDYINNFGGGTVTPLNNKKKRLSRKGLLMIVLGVVSVSFFVFTLFYKPTSNTATTTPTTDNTKNVVALTNQEKEQAKSFVNTLLTLIASNKQSEITPLILENMSTVPLQLPSTATAKGVTSFSSCKASDVSGDAYIVNVNGNDRKMYFFDVECTEKNITTYISFEVSKENNDNGTWKLHRIWPKS